MFWARLRLVLARATRQSGRRNQGGRGELQFQAKVHKIIILQISPDLLRLASPPHPRRLLIQNQYALLSLLDEDWLKKMSSDEVQKAYLCPRT